MRTSLSARLTFRIMAVVLVMMAVVAGIVYYTVRSYMLDEAKEIYLGILLRSKQEMRRKLSDVHVAAMNNIHDIERDIDDPEKMFSHVERIVRQNPSIVCCNLFFEPYYYPGKGRTFIPCARRDAADSIIVSEIDTTYHSYFSDVWFPEQMKKDTDSWTKAYLESTSFAKEQEPRMLVSYAVPIHDRSGSAIAILGLDLQLEYLRKGYMKDMEAVHEKFEKGCRKHSYYFAIDQDGTYIIHPDEKKMLNKNYLEKTKETTDALDDSLAVSMIDSYQGSATINVDGVPSWIYYTTVKYMEWTIAIVVPEEVILKKARTLNNTILLVMLFGLGALYVISRYLIRKTAKPLRRFAESADQVALGNFAAPLPEADDYDEVRQLHDAFANMQVSLATYTEELQKTTMQKASIELQLKIANAIQMAMLPKSPEAPLCGEIDLYASLTPALDVGGDLYDYFLRDNRLFFCIGDVSGKGVPAALLMAVARAMFRSESRRADSAAVIIDAMNRNLSEEYTADYFVTMFVGILDLATGHLDYCNAGHEWPIIAGQRLPIKHNLPIGALSDWNFEGQQAQLQPGDLLFLYTDGLSEAENTEHKLLGREHVLALTKEHTTDSPRQLIEFMEAEVHRHAGEAKQSDDITLLAIKWGNPSLVMKASMDDIARLQPFVDNAATQAGLTGKEAKRLRLALEEAVANVINYGEATAITLQAAVSGNELVLTIDDDGKPFDPTLDSPTDMSIPADQRPPGGLGILFIHKMADGLDYQRTDGHNILTIRKTIDNKTNNI